MLSDSSEAKENVRDADISGPTRRLDSAGFKRGTLEKDPARSQRELNSSPH